MVDQVLGENGLNARLEGRNSRITREALPVSGPAEETFTLTNQETFSITNPPPAPRRTRDAYATEERRADYKLEVAPEAQDQMHAEAEARREAFERRLVADARMRTKGRRTLSERKASEGAPENFAKRTQTDALLHEIWLINRKLSGILGARREQNQDFWSFLPSKRRARAKLEEEIAGLRIQERVARMRIAEMTGEYHSDLAQNIPESELSEIEEEDPARVALKTAFAEIGKELKPLAPWRASEQAGDVGLSGELTISQGTISALYKERAQLQAEKEGLMMFLRPFRRNTIELRLQQIGQEVDRLQEKIRTRDIKKKYSQSAAL